MARTSYGQLWSGRASSGSDDEDYEYDTFSTSDLSELESESEYTPDTTEDGAPGDFDDFAHYRFELREDVWVKPRGCFEWFQGIVVKIREPSTKEVKECGTLYLVVFRRHHTNMRDNFSPLDGNLKPDTPYVRARVVGRSESP